MTSDPRQLIQHHLEQSAEVSRETGRLCADHIAAAAQLIATSLRQGGRVLLCGNGGSAADCQHIAAEFVNLLDRGRPRPALGAIALTTDTSLLTAIANDFGFDQVFNRQVEALGRPGDVLLSISTSGTSGNVLRALERARAQELHTVVLTGADGGTAATLADVAIRVPSRDSQHIQEAHIAIGHLLCALVERELFESGTKAR